MITRDADLIVRMIDFSKPGVGTNQYMSKDSFIENVINSDYTQKRLKNGMLKCLFTHQGRDFADNSKGPTPYDDILATHPDLCGVMRDVWIDGDCAYAAIDLLDPIAFPAAAKVKDLIKKGTYVGVSMATESVQGTDGNFEIKELIGCDFTLDNFFIGSGIVTIKKNFSRTRTGGILMNFANRAIRGDSPIKEDKTTNFSLREIIIESKKPFYMVFARRIQDTIRTLKTLKPEVISGSSQQIQAYVNDLVYNWMAEALNGDEKININIGLRLNRFLKNQSAATAFNNRVNIIKNTYRKMGYMSKIDQEKLKVILSDLLNSLWQYITTAAGVDMGLLMKAKDTRKSIIMQEPEEETEDVR